MPFSMKGRSSVATVTEGSEMGDRKREEQEEEM